MNYKNIEKYLQYAIDNGLEIGFNFEIKTFNIIWIEIDEIRIESNNLNYYPNMDVTRPDLKNRLEKELDNYYKNKNYSDLELSTAFMLRNLKINN